MHIIIIIILIVLLTNLVDIDSVPKMRGAKMAKVPIFLVGLWLLGSWAGLLEAAEYMKYKDPQQSIDIRVEDLISRMTLEEKIGQMLQIERKYASDNVLSKYFIGKIQASLFCLSVFSLLLY